MNRVTTKGSRLTVRVSFTGPRDQPPMFYLRMRMEYLGGVATTCSGAMAAAEPLEEAGILQAFWGLSSLDDKERETSARDLLTALSNKQVRK